MHENWVQPSSCPSGLWWKLYRAPAYKDDCGSVEPFRSISTGILISCLVFCSSPFLRLFDDFIQITKIQLLVKEVVSDIQMKLNRFLIKKKNCNGKIWHLFSILKYLYLEHLAHFVNVIMHLGTFHVICNVKSQWTLTVYWNLKSYRITGHLI